jgi:hypothetical protein
MSLQRSLVVVCTSTTGRVHQLGLQLKASISPVLRAFGATQISKRGGLFWSAWIGGLVCSKKIGGLVGRRKHTDVFLAQFCSEIR